MLTGRFMARSGFIALLLPALLAASPAVAQIPNIFDSLFGNPPQRPPADVPEGPPERAPQQQPRYIPPPANLLPAGPPPGARRIRTEPLPPPPGATSAPQRANLPPSAQPTTPATLPPGQSNELRGTTPPASTGPQPEDEVVVEPPAHKIANPTAVFSGLDKITGRITSFDVKINETVRFGALEVTPRVCYTRPPTEAPATDGFVEVDELTLKGELKRIFNGWMFAASPGLNAVEHPIYDVWLTNCKGGAEPTLAEGPPPPPAPPPARAPQRTPKRHAAPQLPPPPPPPVR
jgi:hypothetical protein